MSQSIKLLATILVCRHVECPKLLAHLHDRKSPASYLGVEFCMGFSCTEVDSNRVPVMRSNSQHHSNIFMSRIPTSNIIHSCYIKYASLSTKTAKHSGEDCNHNTKPSSMDNPLIENIHAQWRLFPMSNAALLNRLAFALGVGKAQRWLRLPSTTSIEHGRHVPRGPQNPNGYCYLAQQ